MAGKFRYRLGKALELRVHKEDKAKRDRAAAERERDAERDLLDQLKARLVAAKKVMADSLATGQVANVQLGNDYAATLEKKISDQERRLTDAQSRLTELAEDVRLASRDVKILEKHRERTREAWQAEENRSEAKALNEMAIHGYRKRELQRLDAELESSWVAGLLQAAEVEAVRRKSSRSSRD
ncbi:MAG: flagellar export protein FliJ [Cyanobacteria bacterium REEB65]|nr:flagellar export protein FliJ [Cyanobacteria bacterium REEB65]